MGYVNTIHPGGIGSGGGKLIVKYQVAAFRYHGNRFNMIYNCNNIKFREDVYMLSQNDREISFASVRSYAEASGSSPDNFYKKTNVLVQVNGNDYLYSNIDVQITYNYGYMDYQLSLVWEDDKGQISYTSLGLHGTYSSNFQMFSFTGDALSFFDGQNSVKVFTTR